MGSEFAFGIIPVQKGRILLVKHAKGNYWGFPKGHAEQNESPQESAERELYEETGMHVTRYFDCEPFEEEYTFSRGVKEVTYFLAEVSGEVALQNEETVEFRWLFPDEAENFITFEQSKRVMSAALVYLKSS